MHGKILVNLDQIKERKRVGESVFILSTLPIRKG
jgi:hypothetical protein